MTRANRSLLLATTASVALHLAMLGGLPAFNLSRDEPARLPLAVDLVAGRPVAVPVAESPKPKPPRKSASAQRKQPAPRVAPEPVEQAPATQSPVAIPPDPSKLPPDFAPEAAVAQAPAEERGGDRAALAVGEPAAPEQAASTMVANSADDLGPPAAYPIRRLEAVYDLYYNSSEGAPPVGKVTYRWSSDGTHYLAESVAEGVGIVGLFYSGKFAQRSQGRIGAEGLVPDEYTLRRGRADSVEMARFDWSAATVELQAKGETKVVAIRRGVQDPLSALHQFYFVQPLAASGRFRVADGRKVRAFWYEVVGEELIETALGVINALHMRRADGENTRADVWVDPKRSYLPVKIHAVDHKGRIIEQHISALELEPVATAAVD